MKPRIRVNPYGQLYHSDDKLTAPSKWSDDDKDKLIDYKSSLWDARTLFRIDLNPVYLPPLIHICDYSGMYFEVENKSFKKILKDFLKLIKGT